MPLQSKNTRLSTDNEEEVLKSNKESERLLKNIRALNIGVLIYQT
jgi:hypothetical protein